MLALTLVVASLVPQGPASEAPPQAPRPTAENFREWLTYVRPEAQEELWREVGWRNQLWPAVQEARRLGRPILLWTMNGHPLGCT